VILSILYTTGIRVSELINIRARDFSFSVPSTILIHGKGQKSRYVPLIKIIIPIVQKYFVRHGYDRPEKHDEWVFKNHMGKQFTRQGINYIVGKYAKCARAVNIDIIPEDFSPHKMRHTVAMGMVDSGVDLIYIRDLLGHVSVRTTEVYGKADAQRKREAIEAASKEIVPETPAEWEGDADLKEWLKNFNQPPRR